MASQEIFDWLLNVPHCLPIQPCRALTDLPEGGWEFHSMHSQRACSSHEWGSWQRHLLSLFWPHKLCSDSVDFLNFNFTASFTVSSPPGLLSFTCNTSCSEDKVSQLARCYRQVDVFWKFPIFRVQECSHCLTLMKELHAFLRLMLLSGFNASVTSAKISWRKWFLCSREQQVFWKQKDFESEAWAHSQVPEPELVPVFTQISDLFKWELSMRKSKGRILLLMQRHAVFRDAEWKKIRWGNTLICM